MTYLKYCPNFIDAFGFPLFLNFNKRIKRISIPGIFCTVVLLAILLYEFIQSDMITKTNPNVVEQSITLLSAPPLKFDENHFFIFNYPTFPIFSSILRNKIR